MVRRDTRPMTITIEPLDCGSLTTSRSMMEAGADDQEIKLPVPSWLIHHPDGLVLVDCGMHADLTDPGDYLDTVSLFFEVELATDQLIGGALNARGIDTSDIDVVILSHLHFDHAGGLAQIPDARVIVQADEWAAGTDDDLAAANTFIPADYRLGHDIITVDGEHDLFGDGRVNCLPTPGHTPGHQSVRVSLDDRDVVLCCDCAYFERTLSGGALPPLSYNPKQHAESIRRLQAERAAGAMLIPGHDANTFALLPTRLT